MDDKSLPQVNRTIKMKGIRNIISQRMRESLETAAQATHVIEIDMSEILRLRKTINERGEKVSVTAIMVKAAALALRKALILNSTLQDNEIIIFEDVNIALAIALDNGLVTPVIRTTDLISVSEINRQILDFSTRAKQGKLTMDDFTGGTFTVSNLGMFGVDQFTAIINPPQAGILAIGATKKRAVVSEDNEIVIRPILKVTLTYDHRIVDGAPAAQFLMHYKDICENNADSIE